MLSFGSIEAVHVKAKLLDENGAVRKSTKFSLDPCITTFEMLQTLLAKAFLITSDFTVYYLACDAEERVIQLPLLNDWDLDAAILSSSQPCLRLVAVCKPRSHDDEQLLSEWDVVAPLDIPRNPILQPPRKLGQRIFGFLSSASRSANQQTIPTKAPMTDAEFKNYMDSNGRMVDGGEAFRMAVYQGGIEPSLRKVAWRHLLSIFPDNLTGKERYDYMRSLSREYCRLRDAWKRELEPPSDEMKFVTSMVRKDVVRTDRTHPFYRGSKCEKRTSALFDILCTYALNHPEVSYCQGMSDFASLFFILQEDEAHAYIVFTALMRRLHTNFLYDGVAMTTKFEHLRTLLKCYDSEFWDYLARNEVDDLFFTYRWLVLELKRELPFDDSLRLLEVMWSTLPPDPPLTELSLTNRPIPSERHDISSPLTPRVGSNGSCSTPTPYTKLLALRRNSSQISVGVNAAFGTDRADGRLADIEASCEEYLESRLVTERVGDTIAANAADTLPDDAFTADSLTANTFTASFLNDKLASLSNPIQSEEHDTKPRNGSNSHFYLQLDMSRGSPRYATPPEEVFLMEPPTEPRTHSITSSDSGIRSELNGSPMRISTELQFAFDGCGSPGCSCPTASWLAQLAPPSQFGYGNPFLIFLAMGIILEQKETIMSGRLDFDSIVMLFDRKVLRNDVATILSNAKLMYEQYKMAHKQSNFCSNCTISSDLDYSVSM